MTNHCSIGKIGLYPVSLGCWRVRKIRGRRIIEPDWIVKLFSSKQIVKQSPQTPAKVVNLKIAKRVIESQSNGGT